MSEVIAITSGKGGTGKSTVCAGIGTALANSGFSVVILELDLGFRCLDVFFGIQKNIKYDVSDFISGKCKLSDCINKLENVSGLSLICAPFQSSAKMKCNDIKNIISRLKNLYDYVLIDTGAGLNHELLKSANVADKIFFVVTPDVISIRDASNISDEFYKYGCNYQRLIINKVHKRHIDYGIVKNLDTVIDDSGIQLIGVVPEDTDLMLFYSKGKLISQNSSGYAAFFAITKRIRGENSPLTII